MNKSDSACYLVTGADGFIGSFIVRELLARGNIVYALLISPKKGEWHNSICADLIYDDSIDLKSFAKIDTIIHLAGKAHAVSEIGEGEEYRSLNTDGTRKVLEAAKKAGVRRFVYFSSVKAMGEGGLQEESEISNCVPSGPYGQSKLDAEKLVLDGGYVPEPVVLRPTMVYGPTDKGNLPRMISMIRKGFFPPLKDTGNRRSMVHVEDIVQATILACTKPEAVAQTYIISDGQALSTREIYELIIKALDRKVPGYCFPISILKMAARLGDLLGKIQGKRFIFDSDTFSKLLGSAIYSSKKIEKELGFKPVRSLENSITEIVEFVK